MIRKISNNSDKLYTTILQEEINNCNKGDTIYFEKGIYVLSTIYLKSDITLEFEEGVKILGSLNFNDYDRDEKVDYPLYQDASHSFFNCSMFVAKNCHNIKFIGKALIDMQSVWDEENIRQIVHRGAKCIALKECDNVVIKDLEVNNVTDLAIYFAGCNNVEVANIKTRTYIDGISPDNSKNVYIHDCDIEAGDDGIVFKSSYTLNRLDFCKNIKVENCKIKSRCNTIKFGTETNGGFYDISVSNCFLYDTRITGIVIESVDGAIINNLKFENIKMQNVATPFFVYVGRRMRGPKELKIGKISDIYFKNISAEGPYVDYDVIAWNYKSFVNNDFHQDPHVFGTAEGFDGTSWAEDWQTTSPICGLEESYLENINFENISLKLDGGCQRKDIKVNDNLQDYPEVYVYGRILPSKGMYFRNIKGLSLKNVNIETYRDDVRQDFEMYKVTMKEN